MAAVRQFSIAVITLSWTRFRCPVCAARYAGPAARKMSATSSEVATGSAVWRTLCIGEHRQLVERTDYIPDRARRDPRVERGGRQLRVTQQDLDDADIDAILQKRGRKAVPQRIRPDPLGDARRVRCLGGDPVYLSVADRLEVMLSGEQPAIRMHHALSATHLPPFA